MFKFLLLIPLILTACAADQTNSGQIDANATYRLIELDGVAFGATATISFPEAGVVRGTGPCNSYSAQQKAPYPWFELGSIRASRSTCAQSSAETQFFKALAAMTQAEASGDLLILRNDEAREMVFTAAPANGQ